MSNNRLSRSFSALNAWALAFGCIIGWGAYVMPGDSFLGAAGPIGTVIGIGISALLMILISLNYHYMVQRCPLAGGEFQYTMKLFGRKHAFICSWFLALAYIMPIAMNSTAIALIGRNLLHNVFAIGGHFSIAGYTIYMGEVLIAYVVLVIFAVLCIRGVNATGRFQVFLAVILISGVAVLILGALVNPEASVENLTPMITSDGSKAAGIFAIIAMSPWALFGFDTIPQVAEEFKFSTRKTCIVMGCSIFFGAAVYAVLTVITASVVPDGFSDWQTYIAASKGLEGIQSLPTFYAALQLLGKPGLIMISLSVLAAVLTGVLGFYIAASRLLFSLSREKMISPWFGKLSKKSRTPKNAIIFLMIISMISSLFGRTALGWLVDMSALGGVFGYMYTSASAIKCARKEGNRFYLTTGIIGIIISTVFGILLLVPIEGLNCSLDKESYICLIAWVILGACYYFSKNMRGEASVAAIEDEEVTL